MKTYKKVELMAKNAPVGSYSAGCPTNTRNSALPAYCAKCEIAK